MTFQLENIFKHYEKHTSCIIFVYHTRVNENARLICDTKKGLIISMEEKFTHVMPRSKGNSSTKPYIISSRFRGSQKTEPSNSNESCASTRGTTISTSE